jgi:transcriptional regulator with XRE-family HTH domain
VITIRNSQHLARVFRHLREERDLTRRVFAARLFISPKSVGDRELGRRYWDTDSTIDAANILGFDLALIPQRRRGRRPSGTGWPDDTYTRRTA